jgi:hypothetical protein
MRYCPVCKEKFDGDLMFCPKCGFEFEDNNEEIDSGDWVAIAKIGDKTSADFAKETLESYKVPVVIVSESGFFGQVGLNLPSITGKGTGKFRVHVPAGYREEAENILRMILGDDWERAEQD